MKQILVCQLTSSPPLSSWLQEQEMFDKQEEEGGSDIQRTAEG
jgi:hypothetical protein